MRLLISAGGTGGGIYPGLAVAQAVRRSHPQAEVIWVGGHGGMEEDLVPRSGLRLELIPAAGLHGVGWRRLPGNAWQALRGLAQAAALVRRLRPDALLVTGGYVGVPVALAARLHRVPILAFIPDVEPALALRVIGRFAQRIALVTDDSRRYLPSRAASTTTGYPVREDLMHAERLAARAQQGWRDDDFVLLVLGGSRGARSINRALLACLPDLLREMHVVHVSGALDWAEVEQAAMSLPANVRSRYHPAPYVHEAMGLALAAADLVVSRAGASVLGEYPLFGLPAVLVPYPHAWRYQKVNADYLVGRGAALLLEDEALETALRSTVLELKANPSRLSAMRRSATRLARSDAADRIAREFISLAKTEGARA
ncbi:MAG TPA: undecaprenyldiphospho-muramoylpentapeptide beta-N-acetylglucosaminyltransferase [Anaerolineales bacterium]|nr:undecaprenyldiphospho-muramoylpentapeptide beta-N-acetylglucosaminyltransferase [Anaerolineales bacterium]